MSRAFVSLIQVVVIAVIAAFPSVRVDAQCATRHRGDRNSYYAFRGIGAVSHHRRDLRIDNGLMLTGQDESLLFITTHKFEGLVGTFAIDNVCVGLTGGAGWGLGASNDAVPANVVVQSGLFLRTRRDGFRVSAYLDWAPIPGAVSASSAAAIRDQYMLLAGLAAGMTREIYWIPRSDQALQGRFRLQSRTPFGDSDLRLWIDLTVTVGVVSLTVPRSEERLFGSSRLTRSATLASVRGAVLLGRHRGWGIRSGVRVQVGAGSSWPSAVLVPITLDVVLDWEPEPWVGFGFAVGLVTIPLSQADWALTTVGLGHGSVLISIYPWAAHRTR